MDFVDAMALQPPKLRFKARFVRFSRDSQSHDRYAANEPLKSRKIMCSLWSHPISKQWSRQNMAKHLKGQHDRINGSLADSPVAAPAFAGAICTVFSALTALGIQVGRCQRLHFHLSYSPNFTNFHWNFVEELLWNTQFSSSVLLASGSHRLGF